ncbi:MAG: hypothetical protein ACR2K0_07735 [Acidimicrobiales bacterium]
MSDQLWPWTDWQQGARWDDWNWRRGLAAAALVLASTMGSLLLAAGSVATSWCDFMGLECTAAELRRVDHLRVAAVVVLLLGPLVVFGLRRRVVWALSPPALLVGVVALFFFL